MVPRIEPAKLTHGYVALVNLIAALVIQAVFMVSLGAFFYVTIRTSEDVHSEKLWISFLGATVCAVLAVTLAATAFEKKKFKNLRELEVPRALYFGNAVLCGFVLLKLLGNLQGYMPYILLLLFLISLYLGRYGLLIRMARETIWFPRFIFQMIVHFLLFPLSVRVVAYAYKAIG